MEVIRESQTFPIIRSRKRLQPERKR
jgi:hypothetical protein